MAAKRRDRRAKEGELVAGMGRGGSVAQKDAMEGKEDAGRVRNWVDGMLGASQVAAKDDACPAAGAWACVCGPVLRLGRKVG